MKATLKEIATFNANERVMRASVNLAQTTRDARRAIGTIHFDKKFKRARVAHKRANK